MKLTCISPRSFTGQGLTAEMRPPRAVSFVRFSKTSATNVGASSPSADACCYLNQYKQHYITDKKRSLKSWSNGLTDKSSSSSLFGMHHQCVAPLAANSPHSGLSRAISIASWKVRLCRGRSFFRVAIQEEWGRPTGLLQSLWGTAVRILLASADSSILIRWPNSMSLLFCMIELRRGCSVRRRTSQLETRWYQCISSAYNTQIDKLYYILQIVTKVYITNEYITKVHCHVLCVRFE